MAFVGMGVGLSAVISYLMLFPLSHVFVNILMNYSWIYMAAIFVELALVFWLVVLQEEIRLRLCLYS